MLASSSPLLTLSSISLRHGSSSEAACEPNHAHLPLSLLSKCSCMENLKQIHALVVKTGAHKTRFAPSKLIEFCVVSPFCDLSYALVILHSIQEPDHFVWNTIIRGYSAGQSPILAVQFYLEMLLAGMEPNSYTFPFLLKSCAIVHAIQEGKQIHAQVLKLGFAKDAFIHTSLINMYSRTGELSRARQVFDLNPRRNAVSFTALINGYIMQGQLGDACLLFEAMPVKDVVSWNAMISGYVKGDRFEAALALFQEMLRAGAEPNESTMASVLSVCARSGSIKMGKWVHSWIQDRGLDSNLKLTNALIDMYSKCGDFGMARNLFDGINKRDQVSWNVMIGAYAHSGRYKETLALFRQMQLAKVEPNYVTFLSILPACAYLSALDIGKWIHAYLDRSMGNFTTNASYNDSSKYCSLYTSLIDMYSKCGSIESALKLFDAMEHKSLSCWNAMISGLAMHGLADKAFDIFKRMIGEGFQPDDITFVGILSACSHAGLVDMGQQFFNSMIDDYEISAKVQHYGCMIDLLGRAGHVKEAKDLIKNMEVRPDGAIWRSLLGACSVPNNVELAEYVASQLLELEPENHSVWILLSNVYAAAGRWEDVARTRTSLNEKGMKKLPGCSSIEVDSIVHEFLVGDKSHPQNREIYMMLDEMERKLELAGHIPDISQVLYDIEGVWKEGVLSYHSEKLAIAFGLISTKPGTSIRIVKNLRVCTNCHSASKLISKIYNREIVARDCNRFHRFKDGLCSCNDYW